MALTVHGCVLTTVSLTLVDTQTDGVLAVQDGWVIIAQQVRFAHTFFFNFVFRPI